MEAKALTTAKALRDMTPDDFKMTRKTLDLFAQVAIVEYRRNLKTLEKRASGRLEDNIGFEVNAKGSTLRVILDLEDYWRYVEHGRRPGAKWPPRKAIEEWIRVKPVIPRVINGIKPTERSLAFLIARKISRDGIKATNALSGAVEVAKKDFNGYIGDAILQDVEDYVRNVLAETGG